jgi:hypothetical protein
VKAALSLITFTRLSKSIELISNARYPLPLTPYIAASKPAFVFLTSTFLAKPDVSKAFTRLLTLVYLISQSSLHYEMSVYVVDCL